MTDSRARMVVVGVEPLTTNADRQVTAEKIRFQAVTGKEPFGKEGESEDNDYARWTPQGSASLTINNPELVGKYKIGQKGYVDFSGFGDEEAFADIKSDAELRRPAPGESSTELDLVEKAARKKEATAESAGEFQEAAERSTNPTPVAAVPPDKRADNSDRGSKVDYSSYTKAELVSELEGRGVEVDQSSTKAELLAQLKAEQKRVE